MLRRLAIVFGVLLLLAIFGGAWVWTQIRSAPTWYAPPDPADAEVVELAQKVEYGLVESFHKIRPDEAPWTVRIREHQVNAWLASRLPEWLAHDGRGAWPAELGVPQIHVHEDGIDIALDVEYEGTAQVVVTRLAPQITAGRLHLNVDRVGLGKIALPGAPAERIVALLESVAPGGTVDGSAATEIVSMLGAGGAADSAFDLSDGRRVEMMSVKCTEGAIELTSRTVQGH